MAGESPLSMMRPPRQRVGRPSAAVAADRGQSDRRLWLIFAPAAVAVVLALGWVWLWYYSASVADRALAGWVEREAAAGRVYSCGSQAIGGFPFRLEARCADAGAAVNGNGLHLDVKAKELVFAAEIYHPTMLIGTVAAPLTLAEAGQGPSFVANWVGAHATVRGLPPNPKSVSVTLDRPRLDQVGGGGVDTVFTADRADLQGHVIKGAANDHPVIEAVLRLTAATAPKLHPLVAEPIESEVDAVLRGFDDLAPKPWAQRFREMQAAGGSIEIKSLRIARTDAVIVGEGTLTVNANGRLDGLIRVAIAGIEHIVPLLGLDQLIGQGVSRLTGSSGGAAQGLGTLDRLMPGLGGALRDTANASVIENLKKMGQPTTIDKKPAIVLPLRFSDGSMYLGMLPLGEAPPLF